jgi:hypothetical protein
VWFLGMDPVGKRPKAQVLLIKVFFMYQI